MRRYPVLVLLDANDDRQLTAAIANAEFLADREEIPPLIIVGITNGRDRTHDLTPKARGRAARSYRTAGGAGAFTEFILDEALPFVRSQYRTLPATLLAGHSFGGLFALDAAVARPGAFVGVIAMSPALWWNQSTAIAVYADSLAKLKPPLRLFTTSGGREPTIDAATRRFAARMDSVKPPTLGFAYKRYPDDTHAMTPVPSLIDGLRFIFEPLSLAASPLLAIRSSDSAIVVSAFVTTQRSYAKAARALGLPEALPESFVKTVGDAAMRELKLPRVAVWMLQQNVLSYPESPKAYASLGDALLAAGDRAGARAQFQRAIETAVRLKQPVDTATLRKRDALRGRARPTRDGPASGPASSGRHPDRRGFT